MTYALKKWQLPDPPLELGENANGHVALLSKPEDFACLLLARLGQSGKTISKVTGLTGGQVSYRLRMANIQIRDYAKGNNWYARTVIHNVKKLAAKQLAIEVERIPEAHL